MIQIDMPMPNNCLDCPACNEYLTCAIPVNGRKWGENDVREFGQGRPEWCPLKEQETQKFFVDESGKITPLPVVVRCKDCKHGSIYMTEDVCGKTLIECNHPELGDYIAIHAWDWFCADGEAKESNGR